MNIHQDRIEILRKQLAEHAQKANLESMYGCCCGLNYGEETDYCVIDQNERDYCIYAANITKKEDCRFWRKIT